LGGSRSTERNCKWNLFAKIVKRQQIGYIIAHVVIGCVLIADGIAIGKQAAQHSMHWTVGILRHLKQFPRPKFYPTYWHYLPSPTASKASRSALRRKWVIS